MCKKNIEQSTHIQYSRENLWIFSGNFEKRNVENLKSNSVKFLCEFFRNFMNKKSGACKNF